MSGILELTEFDGRMLFSDTPMKSISRFRRSAAASFLKPVLRYAYQFWQIYFF